MPDSDATFKQWVLDKDRLNSGKMNCRLPQIEPIVITSDTSRYIAVSVVTEEVMIYSLALGKKLSWFPIPTRASFFYRAWPAVQHLAETI